MHCLPKVGLHDLYIIISVLFANFYIVPKLKRKSTKIKTNSVAVYKCKALFRRFLTQSTTYRVRNSLCSIN